MCKCGEGIERVQRRGANAVRVYKSVLSTRVCSARERAQSPVHDACAFTSIPIRDAWMVHTSLHPLGTRVRIASVEEYARNYRV